MEVPEKVENLEVDSFEEDAGMDPGEEPGDLFEATGTVPSRQSAPSTDPVKPLPALEEAVTRVPGDLKKAMEELLRAEFREVIRWNPRR